MREAREDQASGLRRLFARRGPQAIAVAGSDGGTVALGLAAALVDIGHRVLILDRAPGEIATALGLKARFELAHVLDGDRALADVLLEGPAGIAVLPAARGLARLATDVASWRAALTRVLGPQADGFDVWLVNGLLPAADDAPVLVVVAPTASDLTATYGLLKRLAREQSLAGVRIVINRAPSESAARAAYASVAGAAQQFLASRPDYAGWLPGETPAARHGATRSARGHAFAQLAEAMTAGPGAIHNGA
jgi:flagellar biosynthesis protein FlhG